MHASPNWKAAWRSRPRAIRPRLPDSGRCMPSRPRQWPPESGGPRSPAPRSATCPRGGPRRNGSTSGRNIASSAALAAAANCSGATAPAREPSRTCSKTSAPARPSIRSIGTTARPAASTSNRSCRTPCPMRPSAIGRSRWAVGCITAWASRSSRCGIWCSAGFRRTSRPAAWWGRGGGWRKFSNPGTHRSARRPGPRRCCTPTRRAGG